MKRKKVMSIVKSLKNEILAIFSLLLAWLKTQMKRRGWIKEYDEYCNSVYTCKLHKRLKRHMRKQKIQEFTIYSLAPHSENEEILEALAFWRFAKKHNNHGLPSWRGFLQPFTRHKNPYVCVVAMLESLPVSVWRRLLWRCNINFQGSQELMERIKLSQIWALKDNYEDLILSRKTPRIMSWFDRLKGLFYENLMNEWPNNKLRYRSKGSWKYDLGLGFGPDAYKQTSKQTFFQAWLRLVTLQEKSKQGEDEKDNYYVVNDEFGPYLWLFRTARNFWGVLDRQIAPIGHFCPDWWFTVIAQGIFFVISPLAIMFLGMMRFSQQPLSWWMCVLIPPAFVNIVWLPLIVAKIIKSFFTLPDLKIVEEKSEKLEAFFDKITPTVNGFFDWFGKWFYLFVALFVAILLFNVLQISFGTIGTLALEAYIIFYVCLKIVYGKRRISLESYSAVVKAILFAGAVRILFEPIFRYDGILGEIAHLFFSLVLSLGWVAIAYVIIFGITGLTLIMINQLEKGVKHEEKVEKVCDFLENILSYLIPVFSLSVLFGTAVFLDTSSFKFVLKVWALTGLLTFFVFCCSYLIKRNPWVVEFKKESDNKFSDYARGFSYLKIPESEVKRLLKKNRAFQDLAPEYKKKVIIKTIEVVSEYFGCDFKGLGVAFTIILPVVTDGLLDILKKKYGDFWRVCVLKHSSRYDVDELREGVFEILVKNSRLSPEEALVQYTTERVEREAREKAFLKSLAWCFFWIVGPAMVVIYIAKAIWAAIRWILDLSVLLIDMKERLSKWCPMIMPSQRVKI